MDVLRHRATPEKTATIPLRSFTGRSPPPTPPKYVSWGEQLTGRIEARLVFGGAKILCISANLTVAGPRAGKRAIALATAAKRKGHQVRQPLIASDCPILL